MDLLALERPTAAYQASARNKGSAVRCRPIGSADVDDVVALLCIGFPDRSERYWRTGLRHMAERESPAGVPRFGYVLDHDGEIVGVLLTIYSAVGGHLRCNLSSWYVDPRFRGYGVILDSIAMADRANTYINASPAPHTRSMHEARGFHRLGRGLLLAVPALSRAGRGQRVRAYAEELDQGLTPDDVARAREHLAYGCLCLVCSDDTRSRLVIVTLRSLQLMPEKAPAIRVRCLQMVYGPSDADFATWAGAIGRHLLRSLTLLVLLDVSGPIVGVKGRYFPDRKPRLVRGPNPPSVGDLASTEIAVFGP